MKTKIRQGVFETNSSSTHSICIAKDAELTIPQELHFEFGEFGWECDKLNSVGEKASYLYTGLFYNDRKEDIEEIVQTLKNEGIKITVENPTSTDDRAYVEDSGYIDHSDELGPFLNAICEDKGKLMRFLFSPLSFILTGNDNDEIDVDIIRVSYAHDEYYKGN